MGWGLEGVELIEIKGVGGSDSRVVRMRSWTARQL